MRLIIAFFATLAFAILPARADTKLIHAGTLFAVPGQEPLKEQTIVVRDGRITEVKAGSAGSVRRWLSAAYSAVVRTRAMAAAARSDGPFSIKRLRSI